MNGAPRPTRAGDCPRRATPREDARPRGARMQVRGRRAHDLRDEGFALAEVVVGMVLFAIVLVSGLGLLVSASRVTAQNVRRTTAANLLTAQLEAARAGSPQDVPDGALDRAVAVGGTMYAVHQEATYASQNQTTTLCRSAGNDVVFKVVAVTITWHGMDAVAPVHGSTLLAVGVGREGSAASRGILVVTVTDAAGNPASGALVTVGYRSHLTGTTGCVASADLEAGSCSGDAAGADGSAAAGQTGLVPATDLPPGYVRHVSVGLVTPAPPPPPPPPPAPATTTDPTTDPGGGSGGGGPAPATTGGGSGGGQAPATTGGGSGAPPDSGGGGGGGGAPPPPPQPTTPPPPPEWQAS